jgi:hypothetical protein
MDAASASCLRLERVRLRKQTHASVSALRCAACQSYPPTLSPVLLVPLPPLSSLCPVGSNGSNKARQSNSTGGSVRTQTAITTAHQAHGHRRTGQTRLSPFADPSSTRADSDPGHNANNTQQKAKARFRPAGIHSQHVFRRTTALTQKTIVANGGQYRLTCVLHASSLEQPWLAHCETPNHFNSKYNLHGILHLQG